MRRPSLQRRLLWFVGLPVVALWIGAGLWLAQGAAISRVVNGLTQFMASVKQQKKRGSGVGFGDNATCEIVRNGKII